MFAYGSYARLLDGAGATKIDAWTEWTGSFKAYHTTPSMMGRDAVGLAGWRFACSARRRSKPNL